MTIYIMLFAIVVIIAIVCLIWWYREFGLGSTILYAVYIGIILVLLASVFTARNVW